MPRPGVTREQVFETADALVLEGQNPTILAVRSRLGGGSPNTITPLLAEWRALHETQKAAAIPPPPEPVEAVMRQVWGTAWKEAQTKLEGERDALAAARKEMEKERTEMLAEITRLDAALETARAENQRMLDSLDAERRAHEQAKAGVREARALAEEREKRIVGQETELQELRGQIETLRIEAATLSERARHADELRDLAKSLQEGKGRGLGTSETKKKTTRRRRTEPER